ncbi:MAG: hypothetical protein LBU42_03655 [Prevotellaceae bacterium]|jgi:hypothetical protein|nr:hypothetical protein [Prevotellaceae bacterium]
MKQFFLFAALLLIACEKREEPVQFKIEAESSYTFSATANTASFSITSNIPWQATLRSGSERH